MDSSTATGPLPEHRGFSYWMERVLEERERLLEEYNPDIVHDLRVALRRCRSVADVLAEVDPDPAWPAIRKSAKKLFHALGDLRDAQVIDEWAGKLSAEDDLVRAKVHADFEAAEPELREAVERAARKFDDKEWKQLERHLRSRARLVPPGSPAAECLSLERLETAMELHKRALRSEKPEPWHELRIGIKRFRYTVESLLPAQYAAWSDDLKRLQDLLGAVHDLDVLRALVQKAEAKEAEESRSSWQDTITRERTERIETYRQLTLGKTSLWQSWRAALPANGRLEAAVLARLRATARAVDPHPRRTSQLSRIALGAFDALSRVSVLPSMEKPEGTSMRGILRAAARLQNLGHVAARKKQAKVARKMFLRMAKPPGWSAEAWATLGWALRYQRGSEPKPKHKSFNDLPFAQQQEVQALAGILRLARALRKAGVQSGAGIRADLSASAVVLRVPALVDSAEASARIGAGKHLLQLYLAKPLTVYPAPAPEPIKMRQGSAAQPSAASEPVLPFAVASD
jgi:CHAD domain-containing protein